MNNLTAKTCFIKGVSTINSGGGCMIDCVVLPDNRVLGITDECVCVYHDEESLISGATAEEASIDLTKRPAKAYTYEPFNKDSKHTSKPEKSSTKKFASTIIETAIQYNDGLLSHEELVSELLQLSLGQQQALIEQANHTLRLMALNN